MNTQIELKPPLTLHGATLGVISLRRPKVRDLEAMERQGDKDIAKSINLLASLSEQTPDTLRELDAEDFMALSAVIAGFLGGGKSPQ